MQNQIEGTIIYISPTEKVSDKLNKRFLVVLIEGQYPQEVKIEAINAKCDTLDHEREGNKVKVHFNLNGRSYTSQKTGQKEWFTSLSLWKIESLGTQTATQAKAMEQKPAEIDSDSLPF
jgi:translation initiation factor IF-3